MTYQGPRTNDPRRLQKRLRCKWCQSTQIKLHIVGSGRRTWKCTHCAAILTDGELVTAGALPVEGPRPTKGSGVIAGPRYASGLMWGSGVTRKGRSDG